MNKNTLKAVLQKLQKHQDQDDFHFPPEDVDEPIYKMSREKVDEALAYLYTERYILAISVQASDRFDSFIYQDIQITQRGKQLLES